MPEPEHRTIAQSAIANPLPCGCHIAWDVPNGWLGYIVHCPLHASAEAMRAALEPVVGEIGNHLGKERAFEVDWNPDYEISLSLSVAECRKILLAARAALVPEKGAKTE